MKVQDMTQRYRKFKRSWGTWYAFDNATGNSMSLKTRLKAEVEQKINAMNETDYWASFPVSLHGTRRGSSATEFKQRYDGLGISGVSLHSYRYAWAERALKCSFGRMQNTQKSRCRRLIGKRRGGRVPNATRKRRCWPVDFRAQHVVPRLNGTAQPRSAITQSN